jgi:hypothetical protein
LVDLDSHHPTGQVHGSGKRLGEHAKARSDFQHLPALDYGARGDNTCEHIRVDEEVLTKSTARLEVVAFEQRFDGGGAREIHVLFVLKRIWAIPVTNALS